MGTTCSMNGQRQLSHEVLNINRVGNEAKDNPSKDFSTVNGTRTVHET
jgi:hypothetical protein